MTPQLSIGLASLVGAALFFLAGLLAARRRAVAFAALPVRAAPVPPVLAELVEARSSPSAEVESLRKRVGELEAELAGLRARAALRRKPVTPPARPARSGSSPTTEQALEDLLGKLSSARGMRAVVLADELGLPIAGLGDQVSSLAAFGAMLADAASRGRDFLPLGGLRRLHVEDENDATVSVQTRPLHDTGIALVTLSVGSVPSASNITKVLDEAAGVLA